MKGKSCIWLTAVGFLALQAFAASGLASTESLSPGALSVDQAIHEAIEKSPQTEHARSVREENQWREYEALSSFLPKVNLSGNHFFHEKYQILNINFAGNPVAIPQIYPFTTLTLDAGINLFDGMSDIFRFHGARLLKTAAELDQQWADFQTSEQIRLQFYKTLAAMKLRDVAEANVKSLEDHLDKVNALLHGGVATHFDVLRVEVQSNEAKSELLAAEDNIVIARAQLALAMGVDRDERPLTGDLPEPDAKSVDSSLAQATLDLNVTQANRPDIAALVARTDSAEDNHRASYSHWLPRVNLGYQYSFYNNLTNPISDTAAFRSAYALGIFASWNLFDGFASYAKQREAAEQSKQAEIALRTAQQKVPVDTDFWKRRFHYNTALYGARLSDVQKSQESVRLAVEGLRAGTRTNTEVLDAELELFRSRAGVIRAQVDATEALVNLELALGRKL